MSEELIQLYVDTWPKMCSAIGDRLEKIYSCFEDIGLWPTIESLAAERRRGEMPADAGMPTDGELSDDEDAGTERSGQ